MSHDNSISKLGLTYNDKIWNNTEVKTKKGMDDSNMSVEIQVGLN